MIVPATLVTRRVFVDTAAFYAFTDTRSAQHHEALELARRLALDRHPLYTTNFVLAETHALLLARLGRDIALRVLTEIDRGPTTVIRVGTVDERRAREILTQYQDKQFSLTDATSFSVMERLRIPVVFTFDSDFSQAGFIRLR